MGYTTYNSLCVGFLSGNPNPKISSLNQTIALLCLNQRDISFKVLFEQHCNSRFGQNFELMLIDTTIYSSKSLDF